MGGKIYTMYASLNRSDTITGVRSRGREKGEAFPVPRCRGCIGIIGLGERREATSRIRAGIEDDISLGFLGPSMWVIALQPAVCVRERSKRNEVD